MNLGLGEPLDMVVPVRPKEFAEVCPSFCQLKVFEFVGTAIFEPQSGFAISCSHMVLGLKQSKEPQQNHQREKC